MSRDSFDSFFNFVRRMFDEFDKKFELGFSEMDRNEFKEGPGVIGFRIEVRDTGEGEPRIRVERLGETFEKGAQRKVSPIRTTTGRLKEKEELDTWQIKETIETTTIKAEKPSEVVLTMRAPGVKREDIIFRSFGRSLEVIARKTDGRAYFAAFELPLDADPEHRTLEISGDELIIKVPRHGAFS
ncbi:hypothetical protein AKJ45_03565 [candidate division MSBL1 archaeon SCGC-AAA261F19]|uniref:SHSP domain-containing protein n=1 Tax=candidate division MSBL1 archaeon SCGC-AAA261F19 TaxID=1698275 RepID=A0A133V7C1_9EURY|nr:hypothetical protein AKJ45_03565 [candidate division MSBL1 archaeon SCGC-AAA261F19]